MGRGLSDLQLRILDVLPDWRDDLKCEDAPTRREIVALLGLEMTESNRASISRAITRLCRRGHILWVWGFGGRYVEERCIFGQRTGWARATPDQVEAARDRRAAFRARYGITDPTKTATESPTS